MYFTGYPLPQISKFVFAKTWYATEMPRLGSVWTDSLLIDFTDLDQIDDIRDLVGLFVRPTNQPTYESYGPGSDFTPFA